MKTRALESSQTTAFDTEYVTPVRWTSVKHSLGRLFAGRSINVLDVGGGNGSFADKLLELPFVNDVTVMDREPSLLKRNQPHPRKQLLNLALEDFRAEKAYDLVVMNWLLHHLVGDTYADSRANIAVALQTADTLLRPGGAVLVYENMYNDLFGRNVSSHLIYHVTASRALAPVTRRLGANTAGVGVCFQSETAWRGIFDELGFAVVEYGRDPTNWRVSVARRAAFLLRNVNCAYFLLRRTGRAADA